MVTLIRVLQTQPSAQHPTEIAATGGLEFPNYAWQLGQLGGFLARISAIVSFFRRSDRILSAAMACLLARPVK